MTSRLPLATATSAALLLVLAAFPTSATVEPDHLLLARIWASEIGWEDTPEEVAIWQALDERQHWIGVHRGHPITFRQAMRAYSPRATGARPVRPGLRQRWVSGLRLDGRMPEHWRERNTVPWSRYQARWLAMLDRARTRLAGEDLRPSPCAEVPEHWASRRHRADIRRAARAVLDGRWVVVDCGPTANVFFRALRRHPR